MKRKSFSFILAVFLLLGLLAGCGAQEPIDIPTFPDFPPQGSDTEPSAVVDPTEKFVLNRDDITFVNAGESLKLYDGSVPLDQITWSSNDDSVATFANGIVTAVGKGNTTVYAEYNGVKVSCKIYCKLKQENPPTDPTLPPETTPDKPAGPRDPVLAAPTQEVVDASFFDDAAFVGDSISVRLSYYATDKKNGFPLGKAKFLVRGSYGVGNEVTGNYYLIYQGEEMKLTDALAKIGAKKLFIMLGMNDFRPYGIDGTIDNWGKLLESVRQKNPDIQIYIQSMTPVWTGGEERNLNNSNVNSYNEKLKNFAENNGCKFIDIGSYMKDSTGGLATRFCSDSFVHLTDEAAIVWIKVLKAYTGY